MLIPLLLLLPLPTLVLTSPTTPPPPKCTYGAYRCSPANPSTEIQVCDYYGNWVHDWTCQPGLTCQLQASGAGMLPYCIKTGTNTNTGGACTTPGRMECMGQGAIKVCNVMGQFEKVGDCPAGTQCRVMYGIPYCV